MNTTPDEKTEELNIIRGVLAIARGLLVTTMFTKWSNFYDARTLAKAAGILAQLPRFSAPFPGNRRQVFSHECEF